METEVLQEVLVKRSNAEAELSSWVEICKEKIKVSSMRCSSSLERNLLCQMQHDLVGDEQGSHVWALGQKNSSAMLYPDIGTIHS